MLRWYISDPYGGKKRRRRRKETRVFLLPFSCTYQLSKWLQENLSGVMLQIHMTAVEGLLWSTVMDWVFPVAPGKIPDDRISGHSFLYNDLPEISGWLLCTYPYQTHCWSWTNRWVVMTAHHCCSWWRWEMVWHFVSNSHKVMIMLIVILSSKCCCGHFLTFS